MTTVSCNDCLKLQADREHSHPALVPTLFLAGLFRGPVDPFKGHIGWQCSVCERRWRRDFREFQDVD